MKNLFFVTGLRKSGTSMVKSLLDGHPEVFMFPAAEYELFHYTDHIALHADKYYNDINLSEIKSKLSKNSFVERLNKPEVKSDLRESINVSQYQEIIKDADPKSYKEIIELTFRAMAESYSEKVDISNKNCGLKCVLNEEYLPELREWFPNVKMIYVLRNPYGHFNAIRNSMRKGVTREGQKLSWLKNTYPKIATEIKRMQLSYTLMEKWESLYPNNFYVLSYDKLLDSSQSELEKLSDFLGIEFNSSMLKPTVANEIWGGNSWTGKQFEGIDKGPMNRWKKEISPLEIRLINEYFSDIIEKYGFDLVSSKSPLWKLMHSNERPLTYILNRLVFKAPNWFKSYKVSEDPA